MDRTLRTILITLAALVLLAGACSGGFLAGHFLFPAAVPQDGISAPATQTPQADTSTPADLQTLFTPFWESWAIIHDQFVDQPVDDVALMQGAIRGMLQALGDKHSSYMDPDEYLQANMDMAGEYDGIGAWVDPTSEYLTIVSPMPDSPAEKAGLRPGDEVLAVDGEDLTGVPGDLVIRKVLGPAGTPITLTIRREGVDAPFDVSLVRAHIVIPSADGEMLDNGIALIHVYTFGDNTTSELLAALNSVLPQHPRGIILDLRNNGGGYLTTAIEVASQFIPDGVIMYEQYGDGRLNTYEALPGGLATDIPLVVLVNEGTASASEIVAGAIQDRGRGQLVGVTSYGKGSVQNWIPLSNDQGAVRITIAKWLTPNERTIHGVGLTPDKVVELTQEDADAGRDPQLDAAQQLLEQMIRGTTP